MSIRHCDARSLGRPGAHPLTRLSAWLASVVTVTLLFGCGTPLPEGYGTQGSGTGSVTAPTATGNALVDRLGAAGAACGKQSIFTVPGGWQLLAVGTEGCTVWYPPGWVEVHSAGGDTATVYSDQTKQAGFLGFQGTSNAECTPLGVSEDILDRFPAAGYSRPQTIWKKEGQTPFGGSVWSNGLSVFTTNAGGTPLVGLLWVLTTPSIFCHATGLSFWEPQGAIEQHTCTILQICNSLKCPSKGGCDPAECDRSCKAEGKAGGYCSSGCVCY